MGELLKKKRMDERSKWKNRKKEGIKKGRKEGK